jgi:hypothetical protein
VGGPRSQKVGVVCSEISRSAGAARGHAARMSQCRASSNPAAPLRVTRANYNLHLGASRKPSLIAEQAAAVLEPRGCRQCSIAKCSPPVSLRKYSPWVLVCSITSIESLADAGTRDVGYCQILRRPNVALLSGYVWSSPALALGHVRASAQSTWHRVPAPRVPQPSAGRRRAASFDGVRAVSEQCRSSTRRRLWQNTWSRSGSWWPRHGHRLGRRRRLTLRRLIKRPGRSCLSTVGTHFNCRHTRFGTQE